MHNLGICGKIVYMALSNERVMELKQIIKEDYGRELSDDEVWEIAETMVGYYDLLTKIKYRTEQGEKNDRTGI